MGDLGDVLVLRRWQGFDDPQASGPEITSRKVMLSALSDALAPGVVRVTPAGGAAQIARRQRADDRRFAFDAAEAHASQP